MTGLTTTAPMAATLDQAVAGDQTAFARIVAAYHADMLHVAYGICGEQEMARDAVQAAWLIAWRKLRSVREPDHLRSWLVAVAANEARHVMRRSHRGRVVEITPALPDRDAPDPAQGISHLDLVNALGRLSLDERYLIALRYAAELDSAELAPLLGISPSGVRERLRRIMTHLRKELGDA
jgi:RNA polymerase sigma-70 factor (ECF subfamily)